MSRSGALALYALLMERDESVLIPVPAVCELDLTLGEYAPTDSFRAIDKHAAVMDRTTRGLIAVTGAADDRDSITQAMLFSAAPKLYKAALYALAHLAPEGAAVELPPREVVLELLKAGIKQANEYDSADVPDSPEGQR